MTAPDNPRDWRKAADTCLATILSRAEDLARDATSLKDLEGMLKLVAEVVGTTLGSRGSSTGGDDDDDT